jgi:hypothetical protein
MLNAKFKHGNGWLLAASIWKVREEVKTIDTDNVNSFGAGDWEARQRPPYRGALATL